jgi:hypothetical protein
MELALAASARAHGVLLLNEGVLDKRELQGAVMMEHWITYYMHATRSVCCGRAGVQRAQHSSYVCMTCTYSPSTHRLCNYFALALHTPAPNVARAAQPFCQIHRRKMNLLPASYPFTN